MRLEAIDMNLLLCLGHLLEEGSVSAAARKMGVTQSTMSHRLTQLRGLIDDELLVRAGRGMRLTPRAEAVLPRVRAVLAAAREVLVDPEGFDPEGFEGSVRLSAGDYEAMTVIEPLVARLAEVAPAADVRVLPPFGGTFGALANGEIDLAIAPAITAVDALPEAIHKQIRELVVRPFSRDEGCFATRIGHPRGLDPLALEDLEALPAILTTPQGGERGFIDTVILGHGVTRRVAVTTPAFGLAAGLAAKTDYLVALPISFARRMPGLQLFASPVELPPIDLAMYWHPSRTAEPRHRWLRGLIRDVAGGLGTAVEDPDP